MVKSTETLMKLDAEDKEWLSGLFRQMENRFQKLEATVSDEVQRLDMKIEHTETTLLREFHKWASPLDARMRTHKAAFRAIELEIEALADRISKLEQTRPN